MSIYKVKNNEFKDISVNSNKKYVKSTNNSKKRN